VCMYVCVREREGERYNNKKRANRERFIVWVCVRACMSIILPQIQIYIYTYIKYTFFLSALIGVLGERKNRSFGGLTEFVALSRIVISRRVIRLIYSCFYLFMFVPLFIVCYCVVIIVSNIINYIYTYILYIIIIYIGVL